MRNSNEDADSIHQWMLEELKLRPSPSANNQLRLTALNSRGSQTIPPTSGAERVMRQGTYSQIAPWVQRARDRKVRAEASPVSFDPRVAEKERGMAKEAKEENQPTVLNNSSMRIGEKK